jgi:signal transduction histidine kinase
VEALLFRGAQEALRNVQRHSGASRVDVAVGRENGAVTLRVDDDGRGFAPADREAARADGHLGLELLHDLVDHAGGRVDIASAPGGGTSVAIAVPLP